MGILEGRAPFGADASKCSHRPSPSPRTPPTKCWLPKSSDQSNSNKSDPKSPEVPALFRTPPEMNCPAALCSGDHDYPHPERAGRLSQLTSQETAELGFEPSQSDSRICALSRAGVGGGRPGGPGIWEYDSGSALCICV